MRYIDPCEDLFRPIHQLRCPQYEWEDEDGYREIYAYDHNGSTIVTVPVSQAGYDRLNELHIVLGQMLHYMKERLAPTEISGYNVNVVNMVGLNESTEAGASRPSEREHLHGNSEAR